MGLMGFFSMATFRGRSWIPYAFGSLVLRGLRGREAVTINGHYEAEGRPRAGSGLDNIVLPQHPFAKIWRCPYSFWQHNITCVINRVLAVPISK